MLTRHKLKSSTLGALFLVAALLALFTPAPRADQPGWKAIKAAASSGWTYGGAHTCALRWNGTVRCWGANDLGQLGNNATASESIPVDVSGLNEFEVVAISVGPGVSCAVLGDGTARCWGFNTFGQLGNGESSYYPDPIDPLFEKTPMQVSNLAGAVVEMGSGDDFTCALLKNGSVWCWGWNDYGQLGNELPWNLPFPYVRVSGLTHAIAISVGAGHACALLKGGTVRCWGRNQSGQLGNGSTTGSTVPVAVSKLTGAVAVSAGESHTCAVLGSGAVRCWGANDHSQLGSGTKITGSKVPVGVAFLGGTRKVTAGSTHTCALLNDGTARCWGSNSWGQLGNGTTIGSAFPVTVFE